jgi:hypothetical protein
MSTPNIVISTDNTIVAPGPIVGDADGKVGFYGSEGAVQAAAIAALDNAATGAEIATAVNSLIDALVALNLIAAE